MSERNILGLAFKANLEKNPDIFTFDEKKFEATQKKLRTERDKQSGGVRQPNLHAEYHQLRTQLYQLRQTAENAEVYRNNIAGTVQNLEERINSALANKKKASAEDRLGDERYLERIIVQLESELFDANKELKRAEQQNASATRALQKFEGAERLAELKEKFER
jgi:hypothetical protein